MMQLKGQLHFNKRSSSLMCSTCSSPSASRPLFSRMSPPRSGGLLTSLLGSQPRFNAESSSSSCSPSSYSTLRRSTYVCNSAQLCTAIQRGCCTWTKALLIQSVQDTNLKFQTPKYNSKTMNFQPIIGKAKYGTYVYIFVSCLFTIFQTNFPLPETFWLF